MGSGFLTSRQSAVPELCSAVPGLCSTVPGLCNTIPDLCIPVIGTWLYSIIIISRGLQGSNFVLQLLQLFLGREVIDADRLQEELKA